MTTENNNEMVFARNMATTLAEIVIEIIDNRDLPASTAIAIAGGIQAVTGDGDHQGETLAQRVGRQIHIQVVGESLPGANSPDPSKELQDALWRALLEQADWDAVGQHYANRARAVANGEEA